MYHLETTIARGQRVLKNTPAARRYELAAQERVRAINEYCWDDRRGFFVDYNFHTGRPTGVLSGAAVFPLYVKIASESQAQAVADRLEKDFLKPGGLLSTLHDNGQQWDSPNGWAPLHWVAIVGLRNYGFDNLADEISARWLAVNQRVFDAKGKLVEKYNVLHKEGQAEGGGGEYPLQDGFGWTNVVAAALLDGIERKS